MTPQEFRAAAQEWCATINPEAWIAASVHTATCFNRRPVDLSLHDAVPSECLHAVGETFEDALAALKTKYATEKAALREKAIAKAHATLRALEAA